MEYIRLAVIRDDGVYFSEKVGMENTLFNGFIISARKWDKEYISNVINEIIKENGEFWSSMAADVGFPIDGADDSNKWIDMLSQTAVIIVNRSTKRRYISDARNATRSLEEGKYHVINRGIFIDSADYYVDYEVWCDDKDLVRECINKYRCKETRKLGRIRFIAHTKEKCTYVSRPFFIDKHLLKEFLDKIGISLYSVKEGSNNFETANNFHLMLENFAMQNNVYDEFGMVLKQGLPVKELYRQINSDNFKNLNKIYHSADVVCEYTVQTGLMFFYYHGRLGDRRIPCKYRNKHVRVLTVPEESLLRMSCEKRAITEYRRCKYGFYPEEAFNTIGQKNVISQREVC